MDLAGIASSAQNNISDAGVSNQVANQVLGKAINIDQTNATALIQAVDQAPTTPNLPANLGKHVNTVA